MLPLVFNQMGFGIVFYLIFLILFLFAALTSSISLLELNVSNFTKMIILNESYISYCKYISIYY